MVKVICVTGSVCSGKTTVARKLARILKYEYVDVNNVIENNKNVVSSYDKKRKTKNIDIKKLNKILIKLIETSKNDLIIDSHLSHYLPPKTVNVCIVCGCSDLKKLKKRLKKRKYSKLKISENLEAEILETCLVEATELKHNVVVVDSSKKIDYEKLKKDLIKDL